MTKKRLTIQNPRRSTTKIIKKLKMIRRKTTRSLRRMRVRRRETRMAKRRTRKLLTRLEMLGLLRGKVMSEGQHEI